MPSFVDKLTVEGLFTGNTVCMSPTSTVIAAGTLTLTVESDTAQIFTGSTAGQIVQLPNATTLTQGWRYELANTSSQPIQINDGAGASLFILASQSKAYIELVSNVAAAGTWFFWQILASVTASGVINYNVVSSTAFTTSSANDVLITGFQVTPQPGQYALWYNASVYYTTVPKSHWWSFYKAGVQIADSERSQDTAHSNQNMVDATMTIVRFNGSETCDVRVRCDNTGAITVNARTILLSRLGS